LPYALRDPITGKQVDFNLRRIVDPQRSVIAEEGELSVYFPEGAAFEPTPLNIRRVPASAGMYSDVYEVGWREIPLRAPYVLSMKPNQPGRPEHMVIAKKDARGRWVFLAKEYDEKGYLHAAASAFGSFCVMADSAAPRIRPLNFNAGSQISGEQNTLVLEVLDDFSGVDAQKLIGTIDGKWVLFEYDAKSNSISHQLRPRPWPGVHELEIIAYDQANNLGSARFSIYF
jgi:hypothetical protein